MPNCQEENLENWKSGVLSDRQSLEPFSSIEKILSLEGFFRQVVGQKKYFILEPKNVQKEAEMIKLQLLKVEGKSGKKVNHGVPLDL